MSLCDAATGLQLGTQRPRRAGPDAETAARRRLSEHGVRKMASDGGACASGPRLRVASRRRRRQQPTGASPAGALTLVKHTRLRELNKTLAHVNQAIALRPASRCCSNVARPAPAQQPRAACPAPCSPAAQAAVRREAPAFRAAASAHAAGTRTLCGHAPERSPRERRSAYAAKAARLARACRYAGMRGGCRSSSMLED